MDDETTCERLNQLGRLAEVNVAAGTKDTGKNEITHEEADRIVTTLLSEGATIAQLKKLLAGDTVFHGYRVPLLRAVEWAGKR